MPEALRLSGVDERKLAGVLLRMLDGEEYTSTERKWAAEECLKLLGSYPPRDAEVPVQIVVDLPAPAREAPLAPAEQAPEVQSAVTI
jgi:hypothetical protein